MELFEIVSVASLKMTEYLLQLKENKTRKTPKHDYIYFSITKMYMHICKIPNDGKLKYTI